MMFAVYFVLAWSVVGGIAALLMGRAIAICSGEQRRDVSVADNASLPARVQNEKPLRSVKAA